MVTLRLVAAVSGEGAAGSTNRAPADLVYAEELAIEPGDFQPHLNAQLSRVPGQ